MIALKAWTITGLVTGLIILILLVGLEDQETVLENALSLGWGILWLPLAFLPSLILSAWSWLLLFSRESRPGHLIGLNAHWIATSLNTLAPAAGLGGDVLKVRLVMRTGAAGEDAVAAAIAGKTVDAITLLIWALVGIGILIYTQQDQQFVAPALTASALLFFGIAGFIAVQRSGSLGGVTAWFQRKRNSRRLDEFVNSARKLDALLDNIYREPASLLTSIIFRVLARVVQTVELWLAVTLIGYEIGLAEALMLRSLVAALRGAAFIVPGGWGIQEGAYMVLGSLVGVPPSVMLTASLATRARELALSFPGLITWQIMEGRWAFRKRRAKGSDPSGH